jgi:hypothetical protein
MRSWTILFPRLDGLRDFLEGNGKPTLPGALDDWFDPPLVDAGGGDLKGLFGRGLPPDRLTGIYFGVEFCQRLIPGEEELREALFIVQGADLTFSFVTPPVTDSGIETLASRFDLLQKENRSNRAIEVIVNDWGTLRVLRNRFPELVPVLGRLMNKMIRDPRIAPFYDSANAPPEGLKVVQQSSVTNPLFHGLLKEWGVTRHEFDNLFQGIRFEVEDGDIVFSVYIPYGYVATGRVCMPGSFHLSREEKFTEYMDCRKECQGYSHRLRNISSPYISRSLELYQRGNTLFYPNTREMIEKVLRESASDMLDRVVYQPELPM